jgi:hypothetical protein
MKRNSTSRSAFFNLRILFALLVGMTGISLALVAANPRGQSAGPSPASAAKMAQLRQKYGISGKSVDPLVPPGFDCSQIHRKGIHKQENFRAGAIMIFCGLSEGGKSSPSARFSKFVKSLLPSPLAYGTTDFNLITGTESFPNVTQSETFSAANPDNPDQIVVAFNDSRGRNEPLINISGASVSTDGGLTFTRLTRANGQSPFDNTFGDPVALYNRPTGTWFTVWLDGGCGGQGLGGYKSTTPEDPDSWTHFCVHNGFADDRESGWADNDPASPFFGNMYVSWNDFNTGNANIFVSRSTDNGATWSSPIMVSTQPVFIRNVQITGDVSGNGDIYIAGMDEGGGGFPHNDTNLIFKSTDGGATWANTYTGPSFPGPGVTAVGYFACMFNDFGGYWRHEGWGQPAAFNGVVHLTYAQHGTGSDPGDVYYIRSTDGGVTFGTPFKLNSDATTRPQWQPNLSVSPAGTLFATWYDARESASCVAGDPNTPCYRMWSRKSNDNGLTWLPDDTLSDVVTPLPAQPDPGIQPTYAGDYDYGSAILTKHVTAWTDGRVAISGQSQQDAFFDRDLVGFAVTTTDPGCGSLVVGTAPVDFEVNLSDPADPASVQASDFTVNGTPADTFVLSNGDATITFSFNTSPVVQGENTMNIPAGAILRASDNDPIFEFNCTFRYAVTQLEVTDTVPPVGGTFSPPAPGTYDYDVNWNMAVDPSSVSTSDLQLGGNTGATVTGVQVINGDETTRFTLNIPFGGSLTANIPAGAIADTFGNPNADFSGSYTVEGCPPGQYTVTPGTDTIVPGDTNIGSDCDDCDTQVALPFPFTLYDQTYTAVNVSSNGRLDFVVPNEPGGYITSCLPAPPNQGPYDFSIFGSWQDLMTISNNPGCSAFPGGTCGIFTSVTGSAPDRIFNIEWRTVLFGDVNSAVNTEVRLYENSQSLRFDVVYGAINTSGASQTWVGGVQGNSGAGFFTQDFCGAVPPINESRTYEIPPCTSPTPTPTPTVTPTPTPGSPTPTPSVTPTPTGTPGHSPTPRPRGTPRPRP